MRRRTLLTGLVGGLGAGAAMSLAPPLAWGQAKPGRWLRLESPHFIMYSTASEDSSREELAALEGFYTLLSRLMPRKTPSPIKLPIYVTRTEGDFEATAPYFRRSNVEGFYSAGIELTAAVSKSLRSAPRQRDMPTNVRADDPRVVLFHEYTHHYVLANNRKAFPAWYVEGIAEFLSTAEFTSNGVEIGKFTQGRALSIRYLRWLDAEKLFKPPEKMTGEEVLAFYAQSWLATHMMFVKPERAKGFDRYVQAMQQGGDPIASFEPAFGLSLKDYDAELRAYKDQPVQLWTLNGIKPDPANITAQRLGASANDLLLPLSFLQRLPSPKSAADTVKRVREEARKHGADPYALQAAALTEVWYGDLNEARRQIDALIDADPKDAGLQHLGGICDLRAAYAADNDAELFKRAQSAFGRAHNLDNSRAGSMFRYAEAGIGHLGTVDAELTDILVASYQMLPQVETIAGTAAMALISQSRFDEAILVLQPLSVDPHDGAFAETARELIEVARQKEPVQFAISGSTMLDKDEEEGEKEDDKNSFSPLLRSRSHG